MVTRPACGIPAAPMLAAVAVKLNTRKINKQKTLENFPASPNCNCLSETELDVSELSDENGSDRLVERRTVHVDGSTDGDNESGHARVQSHLIQCLDGQGHRCGTETPTEILKPQPQGNFSGRSPGSCSESGNQDGTQSSDDPKRQGLRANEIHHS